MKLSIVKWCLVVPLMFASAQTFSPFQVDSYQIPQEKTTFTVQLSKLFVQESSIRILADSVTINTFSFQRNSNSVLIVLDSSILRKESITISYSYLPLNLKPSYSLRALLFKNDSLDNRKRRAVVTQSSEGVFTNLFGPELSKSGSINRGFLVGSNRDLTLSSGFRLQMAGKLSDEIDILAALTDENTPIQPQGNTQTLQEIDNVFVEIKSPTYTATLGDFYFNANGSEFVNVNRKLQGAKVSGDFQSNEYQTKIQLIGATSRGKFNTNQFQGIEGVQGPYRLSGKNNERSIIIIAGSEKVYVDGETMVRGDNNDYSIDYGSAEVIFSTRKLITSASRIVVDFEYSDRQFTRNFSGVDGAGSLGENISYRLNYFREGDDPDAPIDISLSDSDKVILQQAGNSTAFRTGVFPVGIDSFGIGKGNYIAVDTIIDTKPLRFYQFEQGSALSIYNVAFSPVGQGNGDYIRESVGRYKFVGRKRGQYAPIIFLPTPQLHQLFSFQSNLTPTNNLTLEGEYAASSFDQNRFSAIEDNLNNGAAVKFSVRYNPKEIKIGDSKLGSLDLFFSERYKESRFLSLDRIDAVEFGRKWSTDSLVTTAQTQSDEEIREGKISYAPIQDIILSTGFGTLERTHQFSSLRYDGQIEIKSEEYPLLLYFIENISGKEHTTKITNDWIRQKGETKYTFSNFTPSIKYENEHRTVNNELNDSLLSSSYSFSSYSPKVAVENIYGIDASTEFEWRNDDAVNAGSLLPQSNSLTQNYSLSLREIQNFSASTIVTFREKKYEKIFQANNTNQQTTLIKLQSRYRPFSRGLDIDVYYDAATQRTAKLERVFFKVRKGEGQYAWIDYNGNGIADLNDENEFKPDRYEGEYIALTLNSDNLIPIINLKASSRLRISPDRFIGMPSTMLERFITTLSTETYFRIEERSQEIDTRKIYLLDLNYFLRPSSTLFGFQFIQQDLFFFENNPEYSFRFRFNQRIGLSQYASGNEKNYLRERSIRSRFQISNDISNQTDVVLKNDNAVSSSAINQSRQLSSVGLTTDLSYRPETNIELGIAFETSQTEDQFSSKPIVSDFNGQTVRVVYGFLGNGQIRSEVAREEIIIGSQPAAYIAPYELTGGRDFGKNYLWNITSEYRMGGNVQFSLQYSGRTTSRSKVIHTGKIEVKAFF
ncbi:MAG: hypothetical protein Q8L88_14380 [Bacteroidota bacterium]|nr:hypothetical protein [Bacteroidota bacterium]